MDIASLYLEPVLALCDDDDDSDSDTVEVNTAVVGCLLFVGDSEDILFEQEYNWN